MKINFKHYILVPIAILSLIASSLSYLYLYNFIVKKAEAYSDTLKKVELEKERKKNEQETVKMYVDTLSDRNRLGSFFVSEDKVIEFIESVEKIGPESSTAIELSSIKVEEGHFRFHSEVKGSWTNVIRALILIENLPYSMSLDNVRIFFGEKQWNLSVDIGVLTIK
jgi:hypothetical protein